ncbi:flagellar filament capping protein FliD [Paenibacillus alba]|uniref:Flagellar hook-associated protein 2 n=1 Tax=Paenibacillus alba TaxID=1197127 RepID=A0ABU6G2J3_9BACL|nr:flagellar filament capping protein FliD [Paenibacillus alba]MEC0227894.1 flagellar filament capping protein FliD [Paenibacillus alba]
MVSRVSGLNSGMDIESLVTKLMKAENAPVDKLKQKKTSLGWTSDLYREINTKLSSLQKNLDAMRLSGDWKQLAATSSNPTAVTVKADGTANAITHSISVTNLAVAATSYTNSPISSSAVVGSTPVGASTSISAAASNNSFNVNFGGISRTITLRDGDYTESALATEIQTQINNSFGAGKINVTNSSGSIKMDGSQQITVNSISGNTGMTSIGFANNQTNRLDTSLQLSNQKQFGTAPNLSSGDLSFTINGQKISYTASDTLNSIISRVNSSPAGVNMSYDAATDRVTVTSKDTGLNSQVVMNEDSGSGQLLKALGLNSVTTIAGKDANVEIDGVASTRSSNTFSSGGVTYTLNQVTTSPVSVGISQDVESTVAKIKTFVATYNEAVELLNKRVKEDKYRSFTPLTDDQRESMKETDIKLWEDKAKSGLLRSDDILNSTISNMRSLLSATVGSSTSPTYNALYKIGITTKMYNATSNTDSGKLELDETELRKALNSDPDAVVQTFSNYPDGIAQKMYTQVSKSISDIIEKAGGPSASTDNVRSIIGKRITDINGDIADMTAKVAKKEAYYYKMFAAMDSAIGKSNSVLNSLSKSMG